MTKVAAAVLLTLIVLAVPAHAQQRVFVSGLGLDTNPCTVALPCRTFQHAHDIAAVNGEIDVIDPAGYGALVISKGISIQAHGFGGIAATSGSNAITVSVTTLDPVSINGLLIDGGGTGNNGIFITSGRSVQILNSVIRHFGNAGIFQFTSTPGSNLLIEDTVASDNGTGIVLEPGGVPGQATLSRITANNNKSVGILTTNNSSTTIANSVMSNNSTGLSVGSGVAWLAKTVISGNTTGVNMFGPVNSYGDNYIRDNGTPVLGALTPVTTQ
jgi:hypothetical protein